MKLLTNDEILELLETAIRNLIPYAIITIETEIVAGGVIFTRDEIKDLYSQIREKKYKNIENDSILEIVEFQGVENSRYWGVNKIDKSRV